jgi:phage-related protein
MQTLNLVPRGNVDKDYNFGTNKVEYESGATQYQRKWVSPRITFSFSVQGDKQMKQYLENFVLAHGGNYTPFKWTYEGTTYVCRFGESSVKFTEIRGYEGEGTVGYEASISLIVCKKGEY